ncbi:MAG: hypothetical protein U5R30_21255 [Deltaproteobacteria bacterium]|nr:hypothetical protein [Deltaproteobacteria bacterium]
MNLKNSQFGQNSHTLSCRFFSSWRHARITIEPVKPIVLASAEEGELQVIAEFVEVPFS